MIPTDARRATPGDFFRLSWGSTVAFCRHRPTWGRWLLPVSWLLRAPGFLGWVLSGEVWTVGRSTSVVMTPSHRQTSNAIGVGVFLVGFAALSVFLVLVAAALPAAVTLWIFGLVSIVLLVFVLLSIVELFWLLKASRGVPGERAQRRQANTVVLHDLARGNGDAQQGIGVGLLAAMLSEPTFMSARIMAVAATDELAMLYCAAGMIRALPGSRLLLREPLR